MDEINQGMDPVNERKVYLQLVQAACCPGTPQCFLMTPKLLPGLPFTSDVQTLQIWNGTTIRQCARSYTKVGRLQTSRLGTGVAAQPASESGSLLLDCKRPSLPQTRCTPRCAVLC